MIKIIVILFILLFLYYLGLFLFRMMNKMNKREEAKIPDVYNIDLPEDINNPTERINVEDEMIKLDEKKND